MDAVSAVRKLIHDGMFSKALEVLDASSRTGLKRITLDVLRVELFERTGRSNQGRHLVEQLLKQRDLSHSDRSTCEFILGQIAWETEGDTEGAILHVQKAVSLAESGRDLNRSCLFQLRLMVMLADRSGPLAVAPLLGQLRSNILKLADPQVSAALHIFIGETEAKRGLMQSAQKHTRLGLALLAAEPNPWLESVAENTLLANAIVTSDFDAGFEFGRRALERAAESGAASMRRACLGNLGNLCYLTGKFDEAIDYFERAQAVLPSTSERSNACLDSMARVRLAQGRLADAVRCLERIEESIRNSSDWFLYANRHSRLTQAEIFLRQGRLKDGLESAEFVIELAKKADDQLLLNAALLTKSELLITFGQVEEAVASLTATVSALSNQPLYLHAHYERLVGSAILSRTNIEMARPHFGRAQRIYEGTHNIPGLIELEHSRTRAAAVQVPRPNAAPTSSIAGTAGNLFQNVSTLLLHVGHPELIATGIVAILADTGCVTSVTALSRADDGSAEILASWSISGSSNEAVELTIELGSARNRSVYVTLRSHGDIESAATLNALTLLLGIIRDLERSRSEREERLKLWPLDDSPLEDDGAVITGQMRNLMLLARKVARTNVSVLLTGESGTGKEILARAIHTNSARADKPFIPFNCTAVPREMLESQLFGHRRGAFTSADRDNPGLIRAAKGGTLFLDEIGELGLDLQPKLLRFLESGEICPLGEPSPLTVDVRIIAATNRNLEQLVQDGHFREDLFYRLHVIPLAIPPLRERRDEIPALVHHFVARAASEFSKGRPQIAEETMEHFLLHPWPGNVRQLQNEVRRMVALAESDSVLTPASLSPEMHRATPRPSPRNNGSLELAVPLTDKLMPTLSRIEREMIRAALRANQGRLDAAAKALGISRKGLYLKRQRLGL